MDYSIDDPTFSVWGLMQRVENRSTLLHQRRTMSLISREIEDMTIAHGEIAYVFAGFQLMSRFLPQVKRYAKIASTAKNVFVFGVPDVDVPNIPNLYYIPLTPRDALAQEWFLISSSANYVSALVTQEQTRPTDPDEERRFKGIWTFDKDLVAVLQMWLLNMLNVRNVILDNNDYDYRRQVVTVTREIERIEKLAEHHGDEMLRRELIDISYALKQEAIKLMKGTA